MIERRDVIKGGAALAGLSLLGACNGRGVPELRWLGWEHYDLRDLREEFEETHGCYVRAQYFDGNSEAYAKLKQGGSADFHLVMADGFWPQLYHKEGMTVPIDTALLGSSLDSIFPDFLPPNYSLLQAENDPNQTIAVPNCWGGYGLTVNETKLEQAGISDSTSLERLFDQRLAGRISTSARFEENIALAGILVCHELGTIDGPRPMRSNPAVLSPDEPFNPYILTAEELASVKDRLVQQARLLRTRWNDEDTLERMLRSEEVWVSPEWSGIYRRLHFERLDGTSDLQMKHVLKPDEGGLGWVDTWCMTRGATSDSDIQNLAYEWIKFRLKKESMLPVATEVGWAPCVDIRDELRAREEGDGERYIETLFLNRTADINGLYQFDQPSDTAAWEEVWAEVRASS